VFNHDLKLYRALAQVNSLEVDMDRWIQEHPVGLATQFQPDIGTHIVWPAQIPTPPEAFGLPIGECVHNLRSALDNLIYTLVVSGLIGPVPERMVRKCEFPIFGPAPPNAKEWAAKVGNIPSAAQAIIDELQPYKRGDDFRAEALWILHELDNWDKHRTIHPTTLSATEAIPGQTTNANVSEVVFVPQNLKLGTQVLQYQATPIDPDAKMEVNFTVMYFISFDQASPGLGRPVIPTLRWLHDYIVRGVLGPLVRFLV
jgi:hypothetical protein